MSRSNPTANNPNPSERWFQWSGSAGNIQYYDKLKEDPKTKKKGCKISIKLPFTFIVLDTMHTITGYDDQSKLRIGSNEVRDLRVEPLHVKYFKGGPLATGLYSDIKEKVKAAGGKFASSVYIAWRDGGALRLGNLRIDGASLGPWIEFSGAHRKEILEKAVVITGSVKDKNGSVEFLRPTFALKDIKEDTNKEAVKLDFVLQAYLKSYFERTVVPAVAGAPAAQSPLPPGRAAHVPPGDPEQAQLDAAADEAEDAPVVEENEDDVPF